jgi:hypothetical protein
MIGCTARQRAERGEERSHADADGFTEGEHVRSRTEPRRRREWGSDAEPTGDDWAAARHIRQEPVSGRRESVTLGVGQAEALRNRRDQEGEGELVSHRMS